MTELIFAPVNGWLIYLLNGWRFCGDIAQGAPGHHAVWSVMLERDVA